MIFNANIDSKVECWRWNTDKSRVWRHIGMILDSTTFELTFPRFFYRSYHWKWNRYAMSYLWRNNNKSASWGSKNWSKGI